MMLIYIILCALFTIKSANASYGDQSPYYQKCTENCLTLNCTENGNKFLPGYVQPYYLKFFSWKCKDECKYQCMWKTVTAFQKRKWKVPQFHGKWPFVRFYGIQEPASVLFSILNFYVHFTMFRRYKRKVRKDTPLYKTWHAFVLVCLNAWLWSTIFHTRDVRFTEFMDYSCAFTIVIINCYCMIMRIFLGMPKFLTILISTFFLAFVMNHVAYLSYDQFDYGYNMAINIMIGSISALSWFMWCLFNRKQQPYLWKCGAYVSLTSLSLVLEVYDFPPILWVVDSHALWHLSTAIVTPLFYSFIIDDSLYLRKRKMLEKETHTD